MDKEMKRLQNQIANLKALIEKESDDTKLAAYQTQLEEALEAKGALQARMDAEAIEQALDATAEEVDVKRTRGKSAFANVPVPPNARTDGGSIVVTENGEYKNAMGTWNMKANIAKMKAVKNIPDAIKAGWNADPERAEKHFVFWADMIARAFANPIRDVSKALNEGTPANGGYLTPPDQREELLAYTRELSIALQDATVVNMVSDTMSINAELAKASVAWTDEAVDATETSPTFAQNTLTAKRLDGYSKVSNELLQDAMVSGSLVATLMSQFNEANAMEIDKQTFVGTGAPASGIFTAQAGWSQVFGTGSTAFSEILESDFRGLIAKIPAHYLSGREKWYLHHSILWTYVYGLKDSQGRPLFINDMTGRTQGTVFGYGVRSSSKMYAVADSGANKAMAAFGDLSGFYIGERLNNMQLMVDPYSLSRSYQTQFLWFTRWGFAHAMPKLYGRIVTAA